MRKFKVATTMLAASLTILVALTLVLRLAMQQPALAEEATAPVPTPTRELRPTFTPTPVPAPTPTLIRQLADQSANQVVDQLPEAEPAPAASDALMSAWTGIQITHISIPTARVHGADVYPVEYDKATEAWVRSDLTTDPPTVWEDKLPRGALASSPEAGGILWATSHRGIWSAAGPLDSLDQVKVGDWIRVTNQDGKLIHLQVVERYSRVSNGEPLAQLVQPTGQPRLVIYTCTLDGEAAVVVIAEPKLVGELPLGKPVEGNRGLVIPKAEIAEAVETLGEISQAPTHRLWSYPNERGSRIIFGHREMMGARLKEGDLIYLFSTPDFDGQPLQLRVTKVEMVTTDAELYRVLDRVKYDPTLYALLITRSIDNQGLAIYARHGQAP